MAKLISRLKGQHTAGFFYVCFLTNGLAGCCLVLMIRVYFKVITDLIIAFKATKRHSSFVD